MSDAEIKARIEARLGAEKLLTPEDDNFHAPQSDNIWETETSWFWFFVPERKIGCWIYHNVRPNLEIANGGVFLFDDTTWFHMEAPYYLNYSNMKLPKERNLNNFRFPNGAGFETIEPLNRYRLTFKDRNTISYDLDWSAIMEPWADRKGDPLQLTHLDQFGRVTGELILHGEKIKVDCLAMRDRSWHHLRPEPWKDGWGGGTYVTAAASPETSFFGAGPGGFLVLDGERLPLVSGSMNRERDPNHGFMRRITIEGVDTAGRKLHAEGESVSRMAFPISGAHGVCWQSLVKYTINGIPAWGDDQDAWPLHAWAAMRREQMGLKDVRLDKRSILR